MVKAKRAPKVYICVEFKPDTTKKQVKKVIKSQHSTMGEWFESSYIAMVLVPHGEKPSILIEAFKKCAEVTNAFPNDKIGLVEPVYEGPPIEA